MQNDNETLEQFNRLMEIVRILRSPSGCPWDKEQTHVSMKPYVLEEAQEVVDAIDEGDPKHLCEELGDLAMIVVFHAQLAAELGTFSMKNALQRINDKLVSRHPHVFANKPPPPSSTAPNEPLSSSGVVDQWNELKKQEKNGLLGEEMLQIMNYSSPLYATLEVQKAAASVGFDFPTIEAAAKKVAEEGKEILQACSNGNKDHLREEIGDLLFSALNLVRMAELDPEKILRETVMKFVSRFSSVEKHFLDKGGMVGRSIEEMDEVWEKIK